MRYFLPQSWLPWRASVALTHLFHIWLRKKIVWRNKCSFPHTARGEMSVRFSIQQDLVISYNLWISYFEHGALFQNTFPDHDCKPPEVPFGAQIQARYRADFTVHDVVITGWHMKRFPKKVVSVHFGSFLRSSFNLWVSGLLPAISFNSYGILSRRKKSEIFWIFFIFFSATWKSELPGSCRENWFSFVNGLQRKISFP